MIKRETIAREIRRAMLDNPTDASFNKRAEERERIADQYADVILKAIAESIQTSSAATASKFSPGDPVEVRKIDDAIDEIVIRRGDVHIEQMSPDGWFMGINGSDGSYWQFWFGSKNRRSAVEFRHTETESAIEAEAQRAAQAVRAREERNLKRCRSTP